MKTSYNWLKKYINITETPERVAEVLTSIGLEVEAMEPTGGMPGNFEGVVVGHVLECTQHPDADRLRVAKVDVGTGEPLQIVCGAPNVATGQKVAVATLGTTLHFSNGEQVKMKRQKLRGVESMGMICAEDELGLGNSHEGIMVLDAAAQVGDTVRNYISMDSGDTVFEIGLTPNHIDAASHFGIARDLVAALEVKAQLPSVDKFAEGAGQGVTVKIDNTTACPRYSGITVKGIKVQPSPDWLQQCLLTIGVRPINNVVDITNFVLHEIGQPLHAFDLSKVDGNQIVVRTCEEGTPFVTLDGIERKLSANDLMICSAVRPMCIAGVFGGLDAGVTETTTDVFIESAYFNPVWVRKTARRHGLNTDASFRYERGADPEITLYALKRAALLIQELAGGTVIGTVQDVYPQPIQVAQISLNYKNMARLIGKEIPASEIQKILQLLDFTITESTADGLTVRVPTYRVDVTRECDVVEEVLRIYGYNNIEISERILTSVNYRTPAKNEQLQNLLSDYLTANGFNEMMSNSLTQSDYYTMTPSFPPENEVKILNPLSSDLNAMRRTLLFGGLEAVSHNINRQYNDLKLYEFGNVYFYTPAKADKGFEAYAEAPRLALFATGDAVLQSWNAKAEATNFFYLKGYVERLMERCGINLYQLNCAEAPKDWFAEGVGYQWNGEPLVVIGSMAKKLRSAFGIKQEVYAAEIAFDVLLKVQAQHKVMFSELPKYPEVRRDLALVVDEKITFDQLRRIAFKAENRLLKQVGLFDVYRGNKLPDGQKQYALSFVLQDLEKTFTDQQIEQIMQQLLNSFAKEVGATLR
ncbi:MAG: phenylalanine--tRNA ligase subunit beta [Prevotellaceae bacterium]|jgi:phenylalanyl-tRNA synthetase beta chain|nr:phenylalanine--tRNA ligase subunit beta [Prevotellaceae bacterium]